MIYLAKIELEIKRSIKKTTQTLKGREPVVGYKYEKEKKTIESIYKDKSEKDKNSYFIYCLEKEICLRQDKQEEYKIVSITKIKPIGLNHE